MELINRTPKIIAIAVKNSVKNKAISEKRSNSKMQAFTAIKIVCTIIPYWAIIIVRGLYNMISPVQIIKMALTMVIYG